jgi:DNA-binding PadR family transcriptional regulator
MTDSTEGLLRRNWFHVLTALAETDQHGSAIARDVLEQTDGDLRLWPATLYRTLDDMVAAGLIEQVPDTARPEDASARARYYRATSRGRRELADAAERMDALAGTARRRLRRTTS